MALTAHTTAYTGDINDWALETHTFGPYAAAGLANGSYPLLILPENCDIEKITLRCSAAAGANSQTLEFKVAASGTAIGSATSITAAEGIGSNLGADTAKDVDFLATNPQINLTSGTQLWVTAAGTIASLAGLLIQVTTRKTPARRDTSTNAQKVDKSKYFYTSKI